MNDKKIYDYNENESFSDTISLTTQKRESDGNINEKKFKEIYQIDEEESVETVPKTVIYDTPKIIKVKKYRLYKQGSML